MRRHTQGLIFVLFLALILAAAGGAEAQVTINTVALRGDAAPDGGSFVSFNGPILNDAGQAAFSASFTSNSRGSVGLFRGESNSGPVQIVRESQTVPDGNGSFPFSAFDFFNGKPALNNAGQVAYFASLIGTSGGDNDNSGVFLGDGLGELVQIARKGQLAPTGNGHFHNFLQVSLNDASQIAFVGSFNDLNGDDSDDRGVFLGDGLGQLVQIARSGQVAPDGNGRFHKFFNVLLNDVGQITFIGSFNDLNGGDSDDSGVFLGDGLGELVQIARSGQVAPDGNGRLSYLAAPDLNASGQVVIYSHLTDTSSGYGDSLGIFLGDSFNGLVQIARSGQPAPDDNGSFSDFDFKNLFLNDSGQIAFSGRLVNTSDGSSDDSGIFRSDGAVGVAQLVREGQLSPDGNGRFFNFKLLGMNDSGQVAFTSNLTATSNPGEDSLGLYLYDDLLGLIQVARVGDTLLGSTIDDLHLTSTFARATSGLSGFNNAGQIAFQFKLADYREGIAIASVIPEPSTLILGTLACMSFLIRRWQ